MAKAGNATSTLDWIWLRAALALAVAAFGSEGLAKEHLTEWLATKKLPWRCVEWRGLDTQGVARLAQEVRTVKFWGTGPVVDWPNNLAREQIIIDSEYGITWRYGAEALGIKVSHTDLQALLPREPRDPIKPAEPQQLMKPMIWLAWARKEHPQRQNETVSDYVGRLHGLMLSAAVTKVWRAGTLRRRLYDS